MCNSLTSLLLIKLSEVDIVGTNMSKLQLVLQIYVKLSELGTGNLKIGLNDFFFPTVYLMFAHKSNYLKPTMSNQNIDQSHRVLKSCTLSPVPFFLA